MSKLTANTTVVDEEKRRAAAMHRVYSYLLQLDARKKAAGRNGQSKEVEAQHD